MSIGCNLQYYLYLCKLSESHIILNDEFECDYTKFHVRVTHKYIKFKPEDTSQLEDLFDDTTLMLFDYPLDRRRTKGGTYYRDPLAASGQPNSRWTCVPVGQVLPSTVPYEVLDELYLPESDPLLVEFYNTSFDGCINLLIDEAMKRTGNFDTTWTDTAMTVSPSAKISLKLPAKWAPKGTIRRFDDRTNVNVPLEGVKVRAHRWFEIREGLTNVSGFYDVGQEFRYPVDYSIKWERQDFDIRTGEFEQAYFNGPNQKGDWNLDISSGKSRHFAHIHWACIDYFYRCGQFSLIAPPKNTVSNPRLHIAAHNTTNGGTLASTHPVSRFLSVFPSMDFYNPGRRSDFVYGTAIHELAHIAHWGFAKWTYNFGPDRITESWADGVEWVFGSWRYGSYGDPNPGTDSYQERTVTGNPTYTSIVVDLIDNESQRNTRSHGGSTAYPDDRVSGYSINQIQFSLRKLNLLNVAYAPPTGLVTASMWGQWELSLFNDHTNATKGFLDELFDSW